jgi:hypothetical protein
MHLKGIYLLSHGNFVEKSGILNEKRRKILYIVIGLKSFHSGIEICELRQF